MLCGYYYYGQPQRRATWKKTPGTSIWEDKKEQSVFSQKGSSCMTVIALQDKARVALVGLVIYRESIIRSEADLWSARERKKRACF